MASPLTIYVLESELVELPPKGAVQVYVGRDGRLKQRGSNGLVKNITTPDAPLDGKTYGRRNGGWLEAQSGGEAASSPPIEITATTNVKFGAAAGSGITHVLPASPSSGDRVKYYVTASGADRTLDIDSAIKPPSDYGTFNPKTLANGKTWIVAFEYVVNKWMLSVVEGGV